MSHQKSPYTIEVKAGQSLYLCQCGQSKNAPHCDGSHKAIPGAAPKKVDFTEDKKAYLCGCQQSKNNPFCDGTHKGL